MENVVADGRYGELPDRIGHKVERDRAWSALSKHVDWWEPGALKPISPPIIRPTCSSGFRSCNRWIVEPKNSAFHLQRTVPFHFRKSGIQGP